MTRISGRPLSRGIPLTLLTINIGTTSPLLRLPLEIRLKIYTYPFVNGNSNNAIKSRIYVIEERRSWRVTSTTKLRKNRFDLDNTTRKLMALEKTCRQVRNEIREMVFPYPSALSLLNVSASSYAITTTTLTSLASRS